jgi:diacylglycerol kinase (ATP)
VDRAIVILNPNAGKRKLLHVIEDIEAELTKIFRQVQIFQTEKQGDGADLVRRMSGATDVIIAAGGDGTVYELINALAPLRQRPVFSILPGGTCNDFSRTIGMSQNPLQAVKQIAALKKRKIDVGRTSDQYFLNFWGIGLISQVSADVESAEKEKLGRLAYYISTLQHLKTTDHTFEVALSSASGKTIQETATLLIVSNGAFMGGIPAFFPHSSVEDGLLDVLLIKDISMETLWSILQAKVKQDATLSTHLMHFRTPSLRVETNPRQRIDCDGERNAFTPTELTVLPRHLEMLVGKYP